MQYVRLNGRRKYDNIVKVKVENVYFYHYKMITLFVMKVMFLFNYIILKVFSTHTIQLNRYILRDN